jgi:hypothetical protein
MQKKISSRFQPRKVGDGWKIVWIYPDGEEKDAEGGKVYPQRQNAYRRAKQLNDCNRREPYTIYVRIRVQRSDCKEIIRLLKKGMAPSHGISVLDPYYDREDEYDRELRFIDFGLQVRSDPEDRNPKADFDDLAWTPPLESDFLAWMETIRQHPAVLELRTSYQSPWPIM